MTEKNSAHSRQAKIKLSTINYDIHRSTIFLINDEGSIPILCQTAQLKFVVNLMRLEI